MAKKMIAKSKKETDGGCSKTMGRRPLPQQPTMFMTNNSRVHQHGVLPNYPRTFNGSEGDLTLAYNSSLRRGEGGGGGRVRYSPDGRASPEVQVYKTRVIYHNRQECLEDRKNNV